MAGGRNLDDAFTSATRFEKPVALKGVVVPWRRAAARGGGNIDMGCGFGGTARGASDRWRLLIECGISVVSRVDGGRALSNLVSLAR